ncbi:MAG: hypothetical protein IIB00_10475, partial [candidate division Zixibacteria bacterium]|nr:hypothetical protein [candidate division Zixibacteria bacterium]
MASLSLDSSVQYVKGVGPHRAAALSDIGVETVLDLLNYFPRGYIDRSNTVPIGEVQKDQVVTIFG